MTITGKVHCLFEQSGTFKNEFIKLGIPAEGYDIATERVVTSNGKRVASYRMAPLTTEILEKNGFEQKTDIVWHDIYVLKYRVKLANKELEKEQTLMLAKDPYDVFYWIPEMSAVSALNFRYVHELRHLMRLLHIDKEVEL